MSRIYGAAPSCHILHNCSAGWDHQLAVPAMLVAAIAAAVLIFRWRAQEEMLTWPQRGIAAGLIAFAMVCGWHFVMTSEL